MKYTVSNRFLVITLVTIGGLAAYLNFSKPVKNTETFTPTRESIKETPRDTRRIIVNFNIPFTPEGNLSSSEVNAQRSSIAKAQNDLLLKLEKYNVNVTAKFKFIPAMGLEVDSETLEYLKILPEISAIEDDQLLRPGVPFSE